MTSKKGRKKAPKDIPQGGLVQFATRLPADLHRRLKIHCVQAGVPLSEFVAGVLTKALKG